MIAMFALLLALSLTQPAPTLTAARDLAVIDPIGEPSSASNAALERLSNAQLRQRLIALKKENRRAFSDRRALFIERLEAELERRNQERSWDEEKKKREAEQAAANAKLEDQYISDQKRQREVDAAAASTLQAVRASAEQEARILAEAQAEQRAAERRRMLLSGGILGALALAVVAIILGICKRS